MDHSRMLRDWSSNLRYIDIYGFHIPLHILITYTVPSNTHVLSDTQIRSMCSNVSSDEIFTRISRSPIYNLSRQILTFVNKDRTSSLTFSSQCLTWLTNSKSVLKEFFHNQINKSDKLQSNESLKMIK